MKTGLLIITVFYLSLAVFVIISHLLRGSRTKYNASLIQAILNQDTVALNTFLQKEVNLEFRDEKTFLTPLMIAASTGNMEIVKKLIGHQVDVNTVQYHHRTALLYAIAGSHFEVVTYLIENGADINQSDKNGNSAFSLALLINDVSFVTYLVDHGVDVNATTAETSEIKYFDRPANLRYGIPTKERIEEIMLHEKASLSAIKYSIQYVVDKSDLTENFWKPPLWYCIEQDNSDLLNVLIKNGADVNWTLKNRSNDIYGLEMNSLMYASYKGKAEIIKFLMDAGVDLNARDQYKRNALYYAIEGKSVAVVKVLFNAGIDGIVDKNFNRTALYQASNFPGKEEIVRTLKELGAGKKK